MDLPKDLKDFFIQEKELEYDATKCECGRVRLVPYNDLRVETVNVSIDTVLPDDEVDRLPDEEIGYYKVPVINLTNGCKGYDPEYILLWLPNEKQYGTYDSTHGWLGCFIGAEWKDIAKDPIKYINSQWHDYKREISSHFDPRNKYEFVHQL